MSRVCLKIVLSLGLLVSGCHGEAKKQQSVDQIRFDHGAHIVEGMTCIRCHANAVPSAAQASVASDASARGAEETSFPTASKRPLLPAEQDCRSCHDDLQRDGCPRCHSAPKHPRTYPPRTHGIHFDHASHDQHAEQTCVDCHGDLDARSAATFEPTVPDMERCLGSCHVDDMRDLRCLLCHTDLQSYRIDEITSYDHEAGFTRRHGIAARSDSALCTQCHEPTYCEDCHLVTPGAPLEAWNATAVEREFVHRGDFFARHGVEADLQRGTCVQCHGVSFCDGCHTASGIGGSVAPGSPHPPGWLDPLSSFGHASAARRDLLSCVSCHDSDAEQVCVPCHRVGGAAGNPHPPGFSGGVDPQQHAVCRVCHAP